MPSTSKKQRNFMAAVAHSPAFAKKVGVSQSVGKDFNNADKGKTFKEGGTMKPVDMKKNPGMAKLPTTVRNKMGFMKEGGTAHSDIKMDKKVVKKAVGMHDKQQHGGKKTDLATLKKGGMACAPKKMASGGLAAGHKSANGIAKKGLTKGKEVRMKKGGAC
jgi:hypothetical protein